jgi:hypothetical protein
MQVSQDACLRALDDVAAEAREIAGTGTAGINRRCDAGGAAKLVGVDAQRRAAPIHMSVHVDQARADHVAAAITHLCLQAGFQDFGDARDFAVFETNVANRVDVLRRIDNPAAA